MVIDTATTTAERLLTVEFAVKTFSTQRREIEGHAAAWSLDQVGDIIEPGAFSRTLRERGAGSIEVYVGHDYSRLPIGLVVEAYEDAKGLFTRTKVFETTAGSDLLATTKAMMAAGRPLSMSIGYRTRKSRPDRLPDGSPVRRVLDVDLVEVSFTAMPANVDAMVSGLKAHSEPAVDHEAELVAFFENEARRSEAELRYFFDPEGETRDALAAIDAKLADQRRREDLEVDRVLLEIDAALRR